jgi:hypothetical protein
MKVKLNLVQLLPAFVVSASLIALATPAQANPFGFLNQVNEALGGVNHTVNTVRGTGQHATGTLGNLSNLLGIAQPSNAPADPNVQIMDIYAKWYGGMTPADKEIVNLLITQYAEDLPLTFANFSRTPLYKSKSAQDKPKASTTFFKFLDLVKAVPQKDKFLAFAFCVNGGSSSCK